MAYACWVFLRDSVGEMPWNPMIPLGETCGLIMFDLMILGQHPGSVFRLGHSGWA